MVNSQKNNYPEHVVDSALKTAKLEGFQNAETWNKEDLMIWYKSYLVYFRLPIPKELDLLKHDH